jgi:hypothetical protein
LTNFSCFSLFLAFFGGFGDFSPNKAFDERLGVPYFLATAGYPPLILTCCELWLMSTPLQITVRRRVQFDLNRMKIQLFEKEKEKRFYPVCNTIMYTNDCTNQHVNNFFVNQNYFSKNYLEFSP